jgi:hypothetical protein
MISNYWMNQNSAYFSLMWLRQTRIKMEQSSSNVTDLKVSLIEAISKIYKVIKIKVLMNKIYYF